VAQTTSGTDRKKRTIPATMDMMVMHATAIRRGAPGTFPDDDHSYGVDEKEYEEFLNLVE
jgi:ketopantoate hydroxymethyltransferase